MASSGYVLRLKLLNKEINFPPLFQNKTILSSGEGSGFQQMLDKQVLPFWVGKVQGDRGVEASRAISNSLENLGRIPKAHLNAAFQSMIPISLRMVMETITVTIIKRANEICNDDSFSSADIDNDQKLFAEASAELAPLVQQEVEFAKEIIQPKGEKLADWLKNALVDIVPRGARSDDEYDSVVKNYLVKALVSHCHFYISEHIQKGMLDVLDDPTDDIQSRYSRVITGSLINTSLSKALLDCCSEKKWQSYSRLTELHDPLKLFETRRKLTVTTYQQLVASISNILSPSSSVTEPQSPKSLPIRLTSMFFSHIASFSSNPLKEEFSENAVLLQIKESIDLLKRREGKCSLQEYFDKFDDIVSILHSAQESCRKCNEILETILSNPAYKTGLMAVATKTHSTSLLGLLQSLRSQLKQYAPGQEEGDKKFKSELLQIIDPVIKDKKAATISPQALEDTIIAIYEYIEGFKLEYDYHFLPKIYYDITKMMSYNEAAQSLLLRSVETSSPPSMSNRKSFDR